MNYNHVKHYTNLNFLNLSSLNNNEQNNKRF
jgi:hypothetical protein